MVAVVCFWYKNAQCYLTLFGERYEEGMNLRLVCSRCFWLKCTIPVLLYWIFSHALPITYTLCYCQPMSKAYQNLGMHSSYLVGSHWFPFISLQQGSQTQITQRPLARVLTPRVVRLNTWWCFFNESGLHLKYIHSNDEWYCSACLAE